MIVRSLPSRERGLKFHAIGLAVDRHKSLPSRERGLKSNVVKAAIAEATSLPSRERGLKYDNNYAGSSGEESLPSRERGLKLRHNTLRRQLRIVAPLAGAWIEIPKSKPFCAACSSRSPRGSVD